MAVRKSSDRVGRGNEDTEFAESIPSRQATVNLRIPNSAAQSLPFAGGLNAIVTFTEPGTTDTFTLIIQQGTGGTDDLKANINGLTGNAFRNEVARAINDDTENRMTAVATDNSGFIAVTFNVADVTEEPTATATVASGIETFIINSFVNGNPAEDIVEERYVRNGPFTNMIPNKDPLQGLAKAAMIYSDFINTISNIGNAFDTPLNAAIAQLGADLEAAFPNNLLPVTRTNGTYKIEIEGSRRDSNGFVGRGKEDLTNVFVNDIGDYGLRQLIIRIFDAVQDLFLGFEDLSTWPAIRSLAQAALRDFEVEIGEVERAIGRDAFVYSNTVVNGSGDQGLLLYSDQLAESSNSFVTDSVATPISSIPRLNTVASDALSGRQGVLLLKN